MSLLGDTVDGFIVLITSIVDFIINIISLILNLFLSIGVIFETLLNIVFYMFGLLEFFVSIIINPYLLILFLLGTGFWYASFAGNTKKDMITRLGTYFLYVGESTLKIMNAIYTLVTRLIVGILDMI
jgi:hypothetical protein